MSTIEDAKERGFIIEDANTQLRPNAKTFVPKNINPSLSSIKLEDFTKYYKPYNGYNATNTCNPVTARLIIFYNEELLPFLKNYFVSSQAQSVNPTNSFIIQVFIFFFQLIFYNNFYQYNDNEQKWLSNQVNMIEKNIIKQDTNLNLFKEGTKFVNILDFKNKNVKNETNPVNNYIYGTVNELFKKSSPSSLSEPFKNLFLNFMKVINKYYKSYYNLYFGVFYNYFHETNTLQNGENIPPILIEINKYNKPLGKNVLELIQKLKNHCKDGTFVSKSANLKIQFPELASLIDKICNDENSHELPKPQTTWDEIFENSSYIQENIASGNASGVELQQSSQLPQPPPAKAQPVQFKIGDIVNINVYGDLKQGTIENVNNKSALVSYDNGSGATIKEWYPFDELKRTNISQPSPVPAPAQKSQPANDSFKVGDIVYARDGRNTTNRTWLQLRITGVDNDAKRATFEKVDDPSGIGAANFRSLIKTDPTKTMGGKKTFSNRMKNRRKSLKNFKKGFKRQNRSLKK